MVQGVYVLNPNDTDSDIDVLDNSDKIRVSIRKTINWDEVVAEGYNQKKQNER